MYSILNRAAMDATRREDLKRTYRKEKDHRVHAGVLVVRMVYT